MIKKSFGIFLMRCFRLYHTYRVHICICNIDEYETFVFKREFSTNFTDIPELKLEKLHLLENNIYMMLKNVTFSFPISTINQ